MRPLRRQQAAELLPRLDPQLRNTAGLRRRHRFQFSFRPASRTSQNWRGMKRAQSRLQRHRSSGRAMLPSKPRSNEKRRLRPGLQPGNDEVRATPRCGRRSCGMHDNRQAHHPCTAWSLWCAKGVKTLPRTLTVSRHGCRARADLAIALGDRLAQAGWTRHPAQDEKELV
jgi:hypothetical protein